MAQITVNYPDAYESMAVDGIRATLGEDAEGLTDAEVVAKGVRRFIELHARNVNRRTQAAPAVATADSALADAQSAMEVARQARVDAMSVADTDIRSAFSVYDE
jgi:hypothetical protein